MALKRRFQAWKRKVILTRRIELIVQICLQLIPFFILSYFCQGYEAITYAIGFLVGLGWQLYLAREHLRNFQKEMAEILSEYNFIRREKAKLTRIK